MDWDEATDLLIAGQLIRRDSWPADVFVHPCDFGVAFRVTDNRVLTPTDILSDDWSTCGTLQ